MPYSEHPVFSAPPDASAKIWRYTTLSKFLSLLTKSELYFASAKVMADIEWFEGRPTESDRKLATLSWDDIPDEFKAAFGDRKVFEALQGFRKMDISENMWELEARSTYINCWHLGEVESHAMWRVYVAGNEGVCIQSTFARLRDCFKTDKHIHIGIVKYVDGDAAVTPRGNGFYPFVQKRKFFEYEKEIRAMLGHMGDYEFVGNETESKREILQGDIVLSGETGQAIFRNWPRGIYIPVDLNAMIERVYIHPESQSWFQPTIEQVVKNLGMEIEICRSAIRSPKAE